LINRRNGTGDCRQFSEHEGLPQEFTGYEKSNQKRV